MPIITPTEARTNLSFAVFEAALKRNGDMPVVTLPSQKQVYRRIEASKAYSNAVGASTVPPNSSWNSVNRWNGRVGARASHGGLDVALDFFGAVGEGRHYSRTSRFHKCVISGVEYAVSAPPASSYAVTIGHHLYEYRLGHSIEVADFHADKEGFRRFLRNIESDDAVRGAVRDLSKVVVGSEPNVDLLSKVRYDRDISSAIGVAALHNHGLSGLTADAYRSNSLSEGNAVLTGDDGQQMYILVPKAEIYVAIDSNGQPVQIRRELSAAELSIGALAMRGRVRVDTAGKRDDN